MDVYFDFNFTQVLSPSEVTQMATASEMDLRYRLFVGDVEFRVGSTNLSVRWVPVLDFAVSLFILLNTLPSSGHETFDFTESDSTIELELDAEGDSVTVRADYVDGEAECSLAELNAAVRTFLRDVIRESIAEAMPLRDNPVVQRWVRDLERSQ